jgi:phosphoglucan, water dikinase
MPDVQLTVRCKSTSPGEDVAAVGSWNGWNKRACTRFEGSAWPLWTATVRVPDGAPRPVEYKYCIVRGNSIVRWEDAKHGSNRVLPDAATSAVVVVDDGDFGALPQSKHALPLPTNGHHSNDAETKRLPPGNRAFSPGQHLVKLLDASHSQLDVFENALVQMNSQQSSWRQRLSFIRSAFTDKELAETIGFVSTSIDCLATVSVYLSFLSSGQVVCHEDHGHHRPNHHASEAQKIELALDSLFEWNPLDAAEQNSGTEAEAQARSPWCAYVARSIYPQLPSYSSQFTVSVPLTRIRDIAHRGDIPHDLKQEIKHSLQNKLHRCAGPEDLQTCERILARVQNGGYSRDFVEQLQIFHGELREFFNASSLDDRLGYLSGDNLGIAAGEKSEVNKLASLLLSQKQGWERAVRQLETLTKLRQRLFSLLATHRQGACQTAAEVIQKVRLADIELDNYSFTLLASIAKEIEESGSGPDCGWSSSLSALSYAIRNLQYSHILIDETDAVANELISVSKAAIDNAIALHRVKAAVERALRVTEEFSSGISDLYTRRVSSLSRALGVDARAAFIFAEAIIRANVAFQASRLAGAMSRSVRVALKLPPWDPVYIGTASGRVEFADTIDHLTAPDNSCTSVIAVCREADGDEDIPVHVRGIVLGRSLPHLSHLGVRARQAGVVFVCAEDTSAFEQLWNGPTRVIKYGTLVVSNVKGLDSFTASASAVTGSSSESLLGSSGSKGIGQSIQPVSIRPADKTVTRIIPIAEATEQTASAKCAFAGRLAALAEKSGGLFAAPEGVVVPFGIFEEQTSAARGEYEKLIGAYERSVDGDAAAHAAQEARKFIKSRFHLAPEHTSAISQAFPPNTRVMVRSSANCEDLEDMSGAGLYDSIANVKAASASEISDAMLDVWSSLWSRRAASSRQAYRVAHGDAMMAVLVQRMVPSAVSFVAFSVNPVDPSDASHIYIEAAVGMGETLASAREAGQPYRLRVERDSGAVTVDALASYSNSLKPGARGLAQEVVDYSRERLTCDDEMRTALARRIANVVMKLESAFQSQQDIEGALLDIDDAKSVDEVRLFVVQARPQIV